jgi:CheY-like chemotaxis protein
MKILVVEDDKRVRKMISAMTGDLADESFECENGLQALAIYAKHLPDWVLMDLMMPELDGISATRKIISSFPNAKIIIVTSIKSDAMQKTAKIAGACGYVLKENLADIRGIITNQNG